MSEKLEIFRTLIERSSDAIYVVDPGTGRFLDVNEGGCRALGFTRDEHLALTVFDVAVGVDRAVFNATVERAKEAGHATVEALHRRKDGTTYPVEVTLTPVTHDHEYLVVVVRDITERKRIEQALRWNESQLRAVLESTADGILAVDNKGKVIKGNRRFAELWRIPQSLLDGEDDGALLDFVCGQLSDPNAFLKKVQSLYGSDAVDMDTLNFKDGRTFERYTFPTLMDGVITGRVWSFRDVTGQKRMEAALRQSREEFKDLFDNAPIGIHEVDAEGRLVRINNTELKMLGYAAEELLGQFVWKISADEETSRRAALAKLAGTPPPPEGFERRLRRKDGSTFPVWINDRLLRREDGAIIGIRAAIQDITDRRQSELRTADALNFNQMVLQASPAGILVFKASGPCVSANEAVAHITGGSREEVLKQNFRQLESWKGSGMLAAAEAALTGQAECKIETQCVTSFGRQGWFSCRFAPFNFEGEPHLLLIINDVTGRKQAELALSNNEAFLNTVFENIPHMIFVKDAKKLRFVKFNKAGQELLGYSLAELAGKNDHDLFPKELADSFTEKDRQVLSGKEVVDIPEETVQTRDKGERILHTKKIPVFDNAGRLAYLLGISEDITGQKRAEKQLRQLSSAVEHSPASIVITDRAGNIEYVNPKFTEVSGYSPEEVIGKNPRVLKSGEMPVEDYERMWWTITSGLEWRGEFHNRKKSGELFWESASISSISDGSGKITHFVAVKEDITEVKLAREKLKLRESFLSAITENQPGLLWLKDAEGRFLTVNKTFAAACGRSSPEQVHGLTDLDLWPKELAEKYRDDDRRVMSAGNASVVEEMIFIGSKHVWHETFKTPVRDDHGRVIGTTGYARDITERKLAEQQLTEAFNFNQTIISDAAVGITAFKASGRCVLANESAAQTLGGTVPRLLELDFRHIASWHASGMLKIAEEVLASKTPRPGEFHFVSTFGKEVWLVSHFSRFVQNGESHLLHVFSDVTEKKKLEAQFLRSQRMESIGTLAGGIAHDLNNVLAPLLFAVQALKEKVSDEAGQQMLDILEANVRRGANLVKQVLIFGRGVKGERITIQPRHLGREIEHIIRETFPKSLKFETHCAADLWTVTGDPTQIEQVLLNLCVNARDAMPGGGKLSLRMENVALDENYAASNLEAKPGRYVVISVMDSGAGMTLEVQDRIFEPFFTTKELGKGTGLGLSTTMVIVKSHGGFINCYSEPGKGSVFKVYLPASPDEAVETPVVANQSSLLRGNNELILVVDDEEPIRNLVKTMLGRFGYRVLLAANGAEAVKFYSSRRNEIAAVITDMAMPVMDGSATIAALQAINPKVRIIGSSGLDMNEGATGAATAGIRHFMPKPYTAETMLTMLHEVLGEDGGVN
jgi:PAS domain S-box-containing protein